MEKVAVYPGSFDPITYGHLDLVERALKVFDRVIIAVALNPAKSNLFSESERLRLIEDALANHPLQNKISVDAFEGLLAEYVTNIRRTPLSGD
jgi:pantetheine-phosphate adenylyltransferase